MNLLYLVIDDKIQLGPIIGTVIATTIVIIGWFIIAWLNRRNEILKKKLDYRADLLKKIIRFSFDLSEGNTNINLLQEINLLIQLYGKKDENICYQELVEKWNNYASNNSDVAKKKEVANSLQKLVDIAIKRFRKELMLGKLF
jgi:hypothetical protein